MIRVPFRQIMTQSGNHEIEKGPDPMRQAFAAYEHSMKIFRIAARLLCQDFNQRTGFQLMTDMIFPQLCNSHSQYRHSPHRVAIIGKQALVGHAIQRPATIAQCRNLG